LQVANKRRWRASERAFVEVSALLHGMMNYQQCEVLTGCHSKGAQERMSNANLLWHKLRPDFDLDISNPKTFVMYISHVFNSKTLMKKAFHGFDFFKVISC